MGRGRYKTVKKTHKNKNHMEIKTRFALGGKVWTVINCKAVEIEIASIIINNDGIYYRNKVFDLIPEGEAFPTREALIQHLTAE